MKKPWVSVLTAVAASSSLCTCASPGLGGQVQHLHIVSAALHKNMGVDVYLPPGYRTSIKYPVLYLLHGKGGNQNSWMTSLFRYKSIHIDADATALITQHKIKPLIIVSPEIDNGYGINTSKTASSVDGYNRGPCLDLPNASRSSGARSDYHRKAHQSCPPGHGYRGIKALQ